MKSVRSILMFKLKTWRVTSNLGVDRVCQNLNSPNYISNLDCFFIAETKQFTLATIPYRIIDIHSSH